jgi:hypothetical protein
MLTKNHEGETRATARLPNLDIEICHRQHADGGGEQILISLQARPSFEAFGRVLDANPLTFWLELMQMAWSPWFAALPPAGKKTYLSSNEKER